ncbi:MAG: ABC transporter permease [Acidobacteria bacterium]|nr:ABC transporter permease [Acidobacteriota bacterium]
MWERIREIVRKELRQALREPRMRAVLIGPPLIQLIIFGFAVNLDVQNTAIAWMHQDRTPASRELLSRFTGSHYFRIVETPSSDEEAREALDHGRAQAVVRVMPGFARDIARGRTAAVQILMDGTNSNTASIVGGQASAIVGAYGAELMGQRMRGTLAPAIPSVQTRSRVWFNPDLKSRVYFVPGIIVNIIMLVTVMLTAMAIVREKEIGTMEQLMVTPIRPIELIAGKTLPFAMVGLVNMMMITVAALLVFSVPFRGRPLVLLVSTILFLLTTLGAGLFISTISHTQQQAMMSSFFFFQPAFMLNGFAFPIRNMPEPVQWLTYLNPARYFMEIVRGVFLKGTGFPILWPQMLALAALGSAILLLAALRFHKRLD